MRYDIYTFVNGHVTGTNCIYYERNKDLCVPGKWEQWWWRHECGHLATHICQALNITPYGEEIQYIGDDIVEKMWEYAHPLLCECDCCKRKVEKLL